MINESTEAIWSVKDLISMLFGALFSFVAVYISSYAKESGKIRGKSRLLGETNEQLRQETSVKKAEEIRTISDNIELLVKNHERLTTVAEEIRVRTELNSWRTQESEQIKREKIEKYVFLLCALRLDIAKFWVDWIKAEDNTLYDNSGIIEISALQLLYLPELTEKQKSIHQEYKAITNFIVTQQIMYIAAKDTCRDKFYNSFSEEFNTLLSAFTKSIASTVNSACKLNNSMLVHNELALDKEQHTNSE